MTYTEAILIAIVEGLTEFLPVSSTGHMIIAGYLLGIEPDEFTKLFTVNIQFGAILSVIILYYKKFFQSVHFYLKLFAAFIPAAILGFILGDFIDSLLENVTVVAWTTLLGGVLLLFVDKWFRHSGDADDKNISYLSAFKIGLFQCIALIPGVSRSAATIIGGMTQKMNRKNAAEFSFFLAVPTLFAAAGYKLIKTYKLIGTDDISMLVTGNVVAFAVAVIAIKTFISLITKYGFRPFGYYRIVLGLIMLLLLSLGKELHVN